MIPSIPSILKGMSFFCGGREVAAPWKHRPYEGITDHHVSLFFGMMNYISTTIFLTIRPYFKASVTCLVAILELCSTSKAALHTPT